MDKPAKHLREERFASIIGENGARFGRIARVYAGADAEDLVQEVLMQVWRSLPDYDSKSNLATWAYRIALNTAISWRRHATREKRLSPENQCGTDALIATGTFSSEVNLLEQFLTSLTEIDRAVLVMHLDDLAYQEIADSIGVSEGAIRTHMSRIRSQLENWAT